MNVPEWPDYRIAVDEGDAGASCALAIEFRVGEKVFRAARKITHERDALLSWASEQVGTE